MSSVSQGRVQTYVVVGVIVSLLTGWFAFAYLRAGSHRSGAEPSGSGMSNAVMPPQEVAPVGQAVGFMMPLPASFAADFTVEVPPPPTLTPLDPAWDRLPTADKIVDVFPGQVTTLAEEASTLGEMGGLTVDGGRAFVATAETVQAIDLKSGAITTLTGTAGQSGCVPAPDPADVRLQGPAGDVAVDGRDLFVATGCGIAKIDITTGATRFVVPWSGPLTIGPDHHLYVGATMDGQPVIARVDPADGTTARYVGLPAGSAVLGLAADAEFLWAGVDEGPSSPSVLDTVRFVDGVVTRHAVEGFDVVGAGQLASAGPYLYAPSVENVGVLRFTKRFGAWGLTAGGNQGDNDGIWSSASFGAVRGLASDGSDQIWVTDAGNHSLRAVEFSQRAGLSLGA